MKFPCLAAALCACLFASACSSSSPPALTVKTFRLANQEAQSAEEPMTRMEMQRRLRGAVSMEQRRQRLGQYYTILWHIPAAQDTGESIRVVFEYQQASTASKILKSEKSFAPHTLKGQTEFSIIGENFFKRGRVLAWQISLYQGQTLIDSKRSYLWK